MAPFMMATTINTSAVNAPRCPGYAKSSLPEEGHRQVSLSAGDVKLGLDSKIVEAGGSKPKHTLIARSDRMSQEMQSRRIASSTLARGRLRILKAVQDAARKRNTLIAFAFRIGQRHECRRCPSR